MSSYAVPPVGSGFIGHGSPAVSEYNYGTGQYVDRLPAIFGQQNYGEIDAIPYLDELQAQQNLGDSHTWWARRKNQAAQLVDDFSTGVDQAKRDAAAIVDATTACTDAMSQISDEIGLESIAQYRTLFTQCKNAYNESKERYERWENETRNFLDNEEAKQATQQAVAQSTQRTGAGKTQGGGSRFRGRSTRAGSGRIPTFATSATSSQRNNLLIAAALGGLALFALSRRKK